MKKIKNILTGLLLTSCTISFAGQNTGNLNVTSQIENSCFFKVYDINFGEWNINIGETIRDLKIDVLCTKGTAYILSGEDKAGPYPHQNGATSWQRVIQMKGSKPDNPDWLAYRIHSDIPNLPLFSVNNNAINGIGTGTYFSHKFKAYLFGNTETYPGRFIAVTPDVYSDNFAVTVTY